MVVWESDGAEYFEGAFSAGLGFYAAGAWRGNAAGTNSKGRPCSKQGRFKVQSAQRMRMYNSKGGVKQALSQSLS